MKAFDWTDSKEQAALLLAEGKQSISAIAAQLTVSEKTVDRWNAQPEFRARIEQHVGAFREHASAQKYATKGERVAVLGLLIDKQLQIIAERGDSLEMQSVPGGTGGLVCVTWKKLGSGEEADLVPEYTADTGLAREIRGSLEQIAEELGQRVTRNEHTGKNGGPIQVAPAKLDLSNLTDAELEQLDRIAQRVNHPPLQLSSG